MGKKEQIEQLTIENDALNDLLRQIGDIIGVSIGGHINTSNIVMYASKFTAALASNHAIEPSAGNPGLSGGGLDTFDADLDEEIDRANAGQGTALVPRRYPSSTTSGDESVSGVIANIGRELGVDDAHLLTAPAALREILARIRALKGSGDVADSDNPQVSKGDSLQEAIAHNAAMRQHLDTEITRERAIISRVAAAMQISQWDKDGTEIIEKIQRWETFKHVLSRRIKELRSETKTSTKHDGYTADELESHLARLMSTKEFAKWLENKPRGTVNATVMDLAADPGAPRDDFQTADLADLVALLKATSGTVSIKTRALLVDVRDSAVASTELVRLMNLVVLPIVARQRAARA